ncbi:hypothetical protein [Polymorphospora rubra]|uniref:Uncharacterized protein n=1 Tax=Polymorphospora rubra TaxID=338584 RepID=A0A810MV62_9ACTN|nr:hypothetical protein [Polymorphospora rubra]BCJ64454.1 hypothetical protein Prubr_14750 [Polymorphospora rubra]
MRRIRTVVVLGCALAALALGAAGSGLRPGESASQHSLGCNRYGCYDAVRAGR